MLFDNIFLEIALRITASSMFNHNLSIIPNGFDVVLKIPII